jgi:hypothetical protein
MEEVIALWILYSNEHKSLMQVFHCLNLEVFPPFCLSEDWMFANEFLKISFRAFSALWSRGILFLF